MVALTRRFAFRHRALASMRREDVMQCGDDHAPHPRPGAISSKSALLVDLKLVEAHSVVVTSNLQACPGPRDAGGADRLPYHFEAIDFSIRFTPN
jgi:hypothetical protein